MCRVRTLIRALFIIAALAIIFFSIVPDPFQNDDIRFQDKIKHFFAYGMLGALAVLSHVRTKKRGKTVMLSIGLCFVLGGTLEIVQSFIGRDADLIDQLLNTAGAAAGSLVALPLARRLFGY